MNGLEDDYNTNLNTINKPLLVNHEGTMSRRIHEGYLYEIIILRVPSGLCGLVVKNNELN